MELIGKDRSRANRRRQQALKLKSRIDAHYWCGYGRFAALNYEHWFDARRRGMLAHTPCICSCWMCGNQRYWHGMSIADKRLIIQAKLSFDALSQ